MLKGFIKISLVAVALTAVALIPGNSKLIFGYGNTPTFAGSSTNAPVCGREQPAKVVLYEPNHPLLPKATGPNQVRLNWLKADRASKYTIAFGLSSGNYIYGLPDVGNTDNFTVDHLNPGTTYYFAVRGVNDCMPGPWSQEWSARVGGGTGSFTNLNTNSPTVILPPNIPQTPPTGYQGNPSNPTPTPQTGGLPAYVPPVLPTPTPQVGFFQGIWHGFLGIFGIK